MNQWQFLLEGGPWDGSIVQIPTRDLPQQQLPQRVYLARGEPPHHTACLHWDLDDMLDHHRLIDIVVYGLESECDLSCIAVYKTDVQKLSLRHLWGTARVE